MSISTHDGKIQDVYGQGGKNEENEKITERPGVFGNGMFHVGMWYKETRGKGAEKRRGGYGRRGYFNIGGLGRSNQGVSGGDDHYGAFGIP